MFTRGWAWHARARWFVRLWASGGAKFPKLWDSLPGTPMNRRANCDSTSCTFGGEIRNRAKSYRSAPCLSARVDNKCWNGMLLTVTSLMTSDPLVSWYARSVSWTTESFLSHVMSGGGSPATTGQLRTTLPDMLTACASFWPLSNTFGGTTTFARLRNATQPSLYSLWYIIFNFIRRRSIQQRLTIYWLVWVNAGPWRNFGLKSGGPSSRCIYKVGVRPPLQNVGSVTPSPHGITPMVPMVLALLVEWCGCWVSSYEQMETEI